MPEITGIGLVRKLRDHGLTLPVVMATGASPTEDLNRYPSLRITAILLKPYTVKDLLHTVEQTLREPDSAGELNSNAR
jgi:CheY-like chemotaxis protein